MKTTLLRAGALACALLATTALTAPAQAQSGQITPPDTRSVDANGVDLISGDYVVSFTEAAIGSGEGALALARTGTNGPGANSWQNMWLEQSVSGLATNVTVILGNRSEVFGSYDGGGFNAALGNGATLTGGGGSDYIYRASDGTTITFGTPESDQSGSSTFCSHAYAVSNCKALALSAVRPNGARLDFTWDVRSECILFDQFSCTYAWRLDKVSNNFGYEIDFSFVTDSYSFDTNTPDFYVQSAATLSNTRVTGATPLTVSYDRSTAGVLAVTVPGPTSAGLTWRFTSGSGTFAIRRPGSSADDISVAYGSGGVTQVVRDGLTTNYSRSPSTHFEVTAITQVDGDSGTTDPVTYAIVDTNRGRLTGLMDPLTHSRSWVYDGYNRMVRAIEPEGNEAAYTYDTRGNVTQVRFREKGDTLDTGDDITTSATYPCNDAVTCNLPATTTDARGNVTNYEWSSTHGGLLSVTQPAPTSGAARPQTRYSYSQVTAVTGQPVYQLTGISACATGTTGGTPDCVGTADESRTVIGYDNVNIRPTSVETRSGNTSGGGALSATTATAYNAYGDVTSVDGPLAGTDDTSVIRYDSARRRTGAISPDPDGSGSPLKRRAQRVTYRPDGQASAVETGTVEGLSDGDWASMSVAQIASFTYDAAGRPVTSSLYAGGVTEALSQTSYDALGRAECVAQRMNMSEFAASSLPADACTPDTAGSHGPDRIARSYFDEAGRVTRVRTGFAVSGQEANEVSTTYTDNGRVATVTDAEDNMTTYEYDGHDRLVRTRMPEPGPPGTPVTSSTTDYEELTLDAAGRVIARRLRDTTSIAFAYDALGRLTHADMPNSATSIFEPDADYSYDLLGRLLSASHPDTNHATFTYDALGRVTSEAGLQGATSMQYDLAGRRTQLAYPGSGLAIDYDYLVTGEVSRIRENGATSGIGVLATYAYDNLGRRTSLTRGNGTTTGYAYDHASRLTQVVQDLNGTANDLTLDFTHNPAGQIVSNSRSNDAYSFVQANANVADTVNGLNQVTQTGSTGVTHDLRGNITDIGNWANGGAAFVYNARNQLWWAYTAAPGAAFGYDPLGRMSAVIANNWATITILHHDGGNLIAERDNGSGNILRRYVFGPGVNEPLVWYEGSGILDRRWFHADERGSVVAVSDGNGDLVGTRNRYDEYGVPALPLTGRFGYTGQAWIPEAGLYDYRARAYNPSLGRFMQADPIGYGSGMNLYAYVMNDPVNLVDPTGLACDTSDLEPVDVEVCGPRFFYAPDGGGGQSQGGVSSRTLINEDEALTCRLDPLCATVTATRPPPPTRPAPYITPYLPPPLTVSLVVSRRGQRDYCGSGSSSWVPDRPGVNVSAACARHDACYSTLGATKESCDRQLRRDVLALCMIQAGAPGYCGLLSESYYRAVVWFGQDEYDEAQRISRVRRRN